MLPVPIDRWRWCISQGAPQHRVLDQDTVSGQVRMHDFAHESFMCQNLFGDIPTSNELLYIGTSATCQSEVCNSHRPGITPIPAIMGIRVERENY